MNQVVEVMMRLRAGRPVREVARDLAISRNTVRRYRLEALRLGLLECGELPSAEVLERQLSALRSHGRPAEASALEPYGDVVGEYLDGGLPMTVIFARLREEHGYGGSYSSVRRLVRRLRPKSVEGVCRVECAPGEEAQVDFGYAGFVFDRERGRRRKCWVFVMTLSFSRHQYVEFVFDQGTETWLGCHARAFAWFGGVPRRVVLDNLKAGVLKALVLEPILAEPYRRLARHYGFQASVNRPRTPRHKGKVESGVRYVKGNFLAGRSFASLQGVNEAGRRWVMETAGLREHGTTREAPLKRFTERERGALAALPGEPYDLLSACHCKAGRDCHVVVEKSYYSVPCEFIGERLEVHVRRHLVEIYAGCRQVAVHERAKRPGTRRTKVSHYPEHKRVSLELTPLRCRERAREIGPSCQQLVEHLLSDRVQDYLPSARKLIKKAGDVGAAAVEAACRRAIAFDDPTYRRVKQILNAGTQDEELPGCQIPLSQPQYHYARETVEFFQEAGT